MYLQRLLKMFVNSKDNDKIHFDIDWPTVLSQNNLELNFEAESIVCC